MIKDKWVIVVKWLFREYETEKSIAEIQQKSRKGRYQSHVEENYETCDFLPVDCGDGGRMWKDWR